jgi:hypothetical protein
VFEIIMGILARAMIASESDADILLLRLFSGTRCYTLESAFATIGFRLTERFLDYVAHTISDGVLVADERMVGFALHKRLGYHSPYAPSGRSPLKCAPSSRTTTETADGLYLESWKFIPQSCIPSDILAV